MVVPIRHVSGSFRQRWPSEVFEAAFYGGNPDIVRLPHLAHPLLLRRQRSAPIFLKRLRCRVIERRRWPRQKVAWVARVLLDEGVVIVAKAVEASRHGLRLAADQLAAVLPRGGKCRVEVSLAGGEATFSREAEVRHVGEHGVGLAIAEPLPSAVLSSLDEAPMGDAGAASSKPNERPSPGRTLRSIASTLYRR